MKTSILFSIFLIAWCTHSQAQINPQYQDSLLAHGELKLLTKELLSFHKKGSLERDIVYDLASVLALRNNIDSAFHYLKIAIKNDSVVDALIDPDFYFLIKDSRWREIEQELIKRTETKFGQYKNLEMAKALWELRIRDQAFYYHLNVANKSYDWDSPVCYALWELKGQINKDVLKDLNTLISKHGWPKTSEVGKYAATSAFLIIQHSDLKTQKKYLPIIKKAAQKGEANKASLALMLDRVNLREGKPQIYGTQFYRNSEGKWEISPLELPQYVNKRRKEVGLPPIEETLKHFNIIWNVEQKD